MRVNIQIPTRFQTDISFFVKYDLELNMEMTVVLRPAPASVE